MLTLSRKSGESVLILLPDGRHITIFVQQEIRGSTRLSIDAPKDVIIFREELLEKARKNELL